MVVGDVRSSILSCQTRKLNGIMVKKVAHHANGNRTIHLKDISEVAYVMSDIESGVNDDAYLDVETGEVVRDLIGGKDLDYDSDEALLDALALEGYDVDEEDIRIHDVIEKGGGTRYLRIPHVEPWQGYQDMKDFVDVVTMDRVRELLEVAIDGSGAFRRFKDVLARYPSWEKQWFAFQRAKEEFRVKEWLEGKGYEVIIESRN